MAVAKPRKAGDVLPDLCFVTSAVDADTGEDLLPVQCWCRAHVLLVTQAEVRKTLTRSCGREGCEACG